MPPPQSTTFLVTQPQVADPSDPPVGVSSPASLSSVAGPSRPRASTSWLPPAVQAAQGRRHKIKVAIPGSDTNVTSASGTEDAPHGNPLDEIRSLLYDKRPMQLPIFMKLRDLPQHVKMISNYTGLGPTAEHKCSTCLQHLDRTEEVKACKSIRKQELEAQRYRTRLAVLSSQLGKRRCKISSIDSLQPRSRLSCVLYALRVRTTPWASYSR